MLFYDCFQYEGKHPRCFILYFMHCLLGSSSVFRKPDYAMETCLLADCTSRRYKPEVPTAHISP